MLFFADEKKQLMASYDGDERCPVDNDSINCIYMLATAAKSTDPLGSDKSHVMVFYDPFGHSNQKTLRGLIMHIRSAGDYDNVKRPMKFEAKWIEFDRAKLKSVILIGKFNVLRLLGKHVPRDKIAYKLTRMGSEEFKKFYISINETESWNGKMNCHSFSRFLMETTFDLSLGECALNILKGTVPTYQEWIYAVLTIRDAMPERYLRSRL